MPLGARSISARPHKNYTETTEAPVCSAAMRLLHLLLASTWPIAACVPRKPVPANSQTAAPAPAPDPAQTLPPPPPVAIHQVSEVEPPPVEAVSEPIPGFMRGINLGNALDAPQEGAWAVT